MNTDYTLPKSRYKEMHDFILRTTDLGATFSPNVHKMSMDDASGVDRTSVPTWQENADALVQRRKAAAANRL